MINFEKRLHHPSPQFMRESWIDMCGKWEFEFDRDRVGITQRWYREHCFSREIMVPFVYQSELSGVMEQENVEVVWYRRTFEHAPQVGQRVLLHLEACDYATMIWVNGQLVKEHSGGFSPFTADLTNELTAGENSIVVRVEDITSPIQMLGKQSWKDENFLCWYTRSTGIWQPIWIETVPQSYIVSAQTEPDIDTTSVRVSLFINDVRAQGMVDISVSYNGKQINFASVAVRSGAASAVLEVGSDDCNFLIDTWSPESPNLYDIEFIYRVDGCEPDRVVSYFGMRKISLSGSRVLLNNKDFYQKLVLNQGYYGKGLMTPQNVEMLDEDVQKIKRCGFNGMRIHQKTETSSLLFLCDYYGLVVWSEIPSFYRDDPRSRAAYWSELPEIIDKQRNHPSVITWVLFNESWGVSGIHDNASQQRFVDAVYEYVRSYDATRPIIGNDGWEHTKTDLLTIHDYAQSPELLESSFSRREQNINASFSQTSQRCNFADGYQYGGQPVFISEFGGIAWGGAENETWGYGKRPENKQDVLIRLGGLMQAIMGLDDISGFCYTQWTDVEQEVNGILDAQHNEKFPLEAIGNIINGMRSYGYIFE